MINVSAPEVWRFRSDVALRKRYFTPEVFSHPAKAHLLLIQKLVQRYTLPGETILDPMAGTGTLLLAATVQRNVILRDLEPSYVALIESSIPIIRRAGGLFCGSIDVGIADAHTITCPAFDHILFSPPYGFETGKGITPERLTEFQTRGWTDKLGGYAAKTMTGGFQYEGGSSNIGNKTGRSYWKEMRCVYARLADLLTGPGLMILVLKNHYRRGKLIDVVAQTIVECEALGFALAERHARSVDHPSHWQRRRVEQGLPIVQHEDILVFRKAGAS